MKEGFDVASGLTCLGLVARLHEVVVDPSQTAHQLGLKSGRAPIDEFMRAAKIHGLKARQVRTKWDRLPFLHLPAVLLREDGGCVILAKVDVDKALIYDPQAGGSKVFNRDELGAGWAGDLLLLTSRATEIGKLARFDFTWFIPALVKYSPLLRDVLMASFFVQILGLATPLLFQVVMDKVLVHQGYGTLVSIAVAMLLVAVMESVLSYLRTYILSHTTCRIDVELGARLFRHLVRIPMSYFDVRRVGDSVAKVRELENIRNFLTGQALTSFLDMLFSLIYIVVMLFYSVWLTLAVVLSLPLYVLICTFVAPVLRDRVQLMYNRGAESQSFLVETIGGINTVKSLAIEPQMVRRWDEQLAVYTRSVFSVTCLSAIGREGIGFVNKIVTLALLVIGAHLVLANELTVGQFIAFNMLASHVASPIIRLSQLWQDFQRASVSVDRLGDILNTPEEPHPPSAASYSAIIGRIEFEAVRFRYRADGPEILKGIGFNVAVGEVIGIVGQSGSGKSTVTKLLQRLHVPSQGRVLVDGIDLAMVDPDWLRRQIGVVLQENLLFRRTVRENIAVCDPGMSIDRVIAAAKLAAAHDFILELPNQYDTLIEEHGANLSGGQRQRLAIARALINNPRIVILDEATSALDYESENAVMANMRQICAGRTVLIIAHRLSTIRQANRIIVMDRGQIAETGTHEELISNQNVYARLHALQGGGRHA